ncbi:MAG: tudor domain-containing protein [Sandaracinaceae bacterium]
MTARASGSLAWLTYGIVSVTTPGCLGHQGPNLPPDVGSTHRSDPAAGSERIEEQNAQPVEVGTQVWANFRDTGFFFFAVVVERREEQHRVVYADGASEWVPASALRPDAVGEDAMVHVRPTVDAEYAAGRVGRRLGEALYVRMLGGDDVWTALPHVRFARGAEGTPSVDTPPLAVPIAEAPDVGSRVLVDYHGQHLRFAGVVTAREDDPAGRLHVVYLDGESEWVDPARVSPDDLREGDEVHVRRQWEPPVWVPGRVRRRIGHAFEVELRDGGRTWTSLFRIRAPMRRAAPVDAGGEGGGEGQP